ncbi:sensor domain-containing protein [Salinibacillus xinjiangensis]|uniref:EAL domain-containing protein n=1 Tax=Salinibacillus xinjiangensis TaxID=1229268 RepID=A0A6G1X9N7_9BACI|nr:EAL domain-containing protein [Salinibacillus xinjiangensis]MRG87639.1 EAL domain-containing protein [Salinibacillus xinjiangensis]
MKKLEKNPQLYRSLFKYSPDGICSLDRNGVLIDINPVLRSILGYSKEELTRMTYHTLIDSQYIDLANERFNLVLDGNIQYFETVCIRKNGDKIPLHITSIPIVVDGDISGVYVIAKDLSKEKEAYRLLEENEEKYRSLFEHNLDAVVELDLDGYYKDGNKKAEELTGFSKSELLNMPFSSLITKDTEKAHDDFEKIKSGSSIRVEQIMTDKNGNVFDLDVSAVPIRKHGEIAGAFSIARDVTEIKQSRKRINELAYTDQITGLPNRNWFYTEITNVITNTPKQMLAILTIDVDNFKEINDLFGHQIGDQALSLISSRLKKCVRSKDSISRVGGDEFIVITQNVKEEEITQLAKQFINKMNQPVLLQEHEVVVTISIGISLMDTADSSVDDLIRQSNQAMLLAKKIGKNNYQFYTKELHKKITRKQQIEWALRDAIEQDELSLVYQPQVDVVTDNITGMEALLRWNPAFGAVTPDEFIPIAEETGLILSIGEWVLREACRQIKKWEKQELPKVRVSVNVSARQFKDKHFPSKVRAIVEEEKVQPSDLEIEITESVMLDVEGASQLIQELKELGVKVAIDDFGTGYSSLNVMKSVEIDTLKIDKSMINDVSENDRMMCLLIAIIRLGKDLNTQVIIEGVETREQKELLKEYQVIAQGYFYSRPLPAGRLQQVWEKHGISAWRNL